MPIASASCRLEGFRSSSIRPHATTGVSDSVTPNCLSNRSTLGSVSMSTQVKRMRFFDRKSRTRKVSGE